MVRCCSGGGRVARFPGGRPLGRHDVEGDVTKGGFDRHNVDRGYVKTGSNYYRYLLSIDESPTR